MKLRHYWNSTTQKCDCGCVERVFVKNWICVEKLKEDLSKQGFKLVKLNDWELKMVVE